MLPDSEGLPAMCEGSLDQAQLDQLRADLAALARIHAVSTKTGPRDYAAAGPLSLDEAWARLKAGQVRAVQVHYHFAGQEYCDTILRTPAGCRLFRCAVGE